MCWDVNSPAVLSVAGLLLDLCRSNVGTVHGADSAGADKQQGYAGLLNLRRGKGV